MMNLSTAARETIEKLLIKYGEDRKYVIYPFGEGGKILKCILNFEYNIQETAIVDNLLAYKNENIKDVSYLESHKDVIVLISSNRLDQFDEIRSSLYRYIEKEKCIEVYEKIILGNNYYPEMLKLTKIYDTNYEFVRIGNKNDGGYVMANNLFGGIAYSFGIGHDPSWDLEMHRRGYEVFMYDHTVECPGEIVVYKEKMHFKKMGLAGSNKNEELHELCDYIEENGHSAESNMVLKIDIEGAEWEFLESVSSDLLNKFNQIVFELHNLNSPDEVLRTSIIKGLSKLNITHRIVHLHGNNWGGYVNIYGHVFPDALEVTYMRKDFVNDELEHVNLPSAVDSPCRRDEREMVLGDWNEEIQLSLDDDLFGKCIEKYYKNVSGKTFYVIGDSHVGFFSGDNHDFYINKNGIGVRKPYLNPFRVIHLGPALAYNLNNYGTNTKAREKIDYIIENGIIPKGSFVLCVFGEIDIRVHAFKQAKELNCDYSHVVDDVLEKYLQFIEYLNKYFKVYLWCPVASQRDDAFLDEKFPRCGTHVERNMATKYFTDKLQELCIERNVAKCLTIFDKLIDENFKTKSVFYKDSVHLSQGAWEIAEPIFEAEGINCRRI